MLTIHQTAKRGHIKKKKRSYVFALNSCPQKKGVVVRIRIDTPRKPNSAKRKIAWVCLSNGRHVLAKIGGIGHNLQAFSNVLVRGGRANDVPGVSYSLIRGVYDFSYNSEELKKPRTKKRSKYGIPRDNPF